MKELILSIGFIFLISLPLSGKESERKAGILKLGDPVKEAVPFEYQHIPHTVADGYFMASKGDGYGVIDSLGNVVVPLSYHSIVAFDPETKLAIVEDEKRNEWVVSQGKDILKDAKEYTLFQPDGVVRIKRDSIYGLYDAEGDEVIPCIYPEIESVYGGLAIVRTDNGGYAVWDVNNRREIIPEGKYMGIYLKDGIPGVLVVAKENGKKGRQYGLIDKKEKVLIPFGKYGSFYPFDKSPFLVTNKENKPGTVGLVDRNGNEIIPCRYKSVKLFSKDYYLVKDDKERAGLINNQGETVVPFIFDNILHYEPALGIAVVQRGDTCGLINASGMELSSFKYKRFFHMSPSGIVLFSNEPGFELLDHTGVPIPMPEFFYVMQPFYNNIPVIQKEGGLLLDKNGQAKIDSQFRIQGYIHPQYVTAISENRAAIFSEEGKQITPFEYRYVRSATGAGSYVIAEK